MGTIYLRSGQPVFNMMTRVFAFLGRGPKPRYLAGGRRAAALSDAELREKAFAAVRELIQRTGQESILHSYGQGVFGDPRFPHALRRGRRADATEPRCPDGE